MAFKHARDYREDLLASLRKSAKEAKEYLRAASHDTADVFLIALQDVLEARGSEALQRRWDRLNVTDAAEPFESPEVLHFLRDAFRSMHLHFTSAEYRDSLLFRLAKSPGDTKSTTSNIALEVLKPVPEQSVQMLVCENPADEAITHQAIASFPPAPSSPPKQTASDPHLPTWSTRVAVVCGLIVGLFGMVFLPNMSIRPTSSYSLISHLGPRVVCPPTAPSYKAEVAMVNVLRCQRYTC